MDSIHFLKLYTHKNPAHCQNNCFKQLHKAIGYWYNIQSGTPQNFTLKKSTKQKDRVAKAIFLQHVKNSKWVLDLPSITAAIAFTSWWRAMYESTCVPIEAVASLQPVTALCLRDRHYWVNFTLLSGNTIGVSVAEQTNDSTLSPIYL